MAMEVMQELGLDAFMVGVSKGEGRKPGLETLHFTDGTKIQLPEDNKACIRFNRYGMRRIVLRSLNIVPNDKRRWFSVGSYSGTWTKTSS